MSPPNAGRVARQNRVVVVGAVNADVSLRAERLPSQGETVIGAELLASQGGKGANQAVAAARCGAGVLFVAAIGEDEVGERMLAGLRAEGVDVSGCRRVPARPSGQASIWIDANGENRILVASGANTSLDASLVSAALLSAEPAAVVLCQLETPIDGVAAAFSWGREAGARTVLNAAPAMPLDDLGSGPDVLIVNQHEARELCAQGVASDPDRMARRLAHSTGAETVIITLGAAGACVCSDGQVRTVASPTVAAVDTTGAGDTFAGAFATRVASRDDDLVAATRFACAAAALATLGRGAVGAMPTAPAVEAILKRTR